MPANGRRDLIRRLKVKASVSPLLAMSLYSYFVWATGYVLTGCELLEVPLYDVSYRQCRCMEWATGSVLCSVNYRRCLCVMWVPGCIFVWSTGSVVIWWELLAVSLYDVSYWQCRCMMRATGSVVIWCELLAVSLYDVSYWQCRYMMRTTGSIVIWCELLAVSLYDVSYWQCRFMMWATAV